jgi:ABC-type Fe3+-hydroxamate transport system substrate-binding protein
MLEYKDQMNQIIRLEAVPRRIISVVPSQTELLYDLGLEERVVGITKFCIYPNSWYRSKSRVGGTKDIDLNKVKALKPDLIIGNKEENSKENIEALKRIAPVWMSDIFTLEDSLDMITRIGNLLQVQEKAISTKLMIQCQFHALQKMNSPKSVLYLIWKNPYLAAGKNTFIDDMLTKCGFINFIENDRYPEVDTQSDEHPDFIFLSSEPYPFKEKHIKELQIIYPKSNIQLVDGEMFSWYGSRLLKAPGYFKQLLSNLFISK